MLEFVKIFGNQFKSFKSPVILEMTNPPGLYFVTGQNLVDPELEENGSGKSTLLIDLPFWVLFGKTPRNLKAKNIHTWGESGNTSGSLIIKTKEKQYIVERSWNPNTLKLNGEIIDQTELDSIIGIDSEIIQHSVFIPQFTEMFFDLQPAQRLALFSSVLNLDFWVEKSKKANDECGKLKTEESKIQQSMKYSSGSFDQLMNKAQEYDNKLNNFESEKKLQLKELKKELKENEKLFSSLLKKKNSLELELREFNVSDIEKKIHKENKEFSIIYDRQDLYKNKITELAIVYSNLSKELKKFESVSETCPYCKQKVSKNIWILIQSI